MDQAWAAGVTFFDTAASYGGGRSEQWVGEWRAARGVPVVLSTKVFWSVTGDPADQGLSYERVLFFQAEGGIRVGRVTGVQTCALPICLDRLAARQFDRGADRAIGDVVPPAIVVGVVLERRLPVRAAAAETTQQQQAPGRIGAQ